jgi:hypothetical protein
MKKEVKNLPASVHQRLKNMAASSGRPFQELFYYHAMERFLYRLSNSEYSESFTLKGGLMFRGWGIPLRRLTRDIDVQAYANNSIENLEAIVRDICEQEVEQDGMRFDPDSVRGEQIMNEADYPGTRIYFIGYLGNASIHLHLDISFANVITPATVRVAYPTLLDMPGFEIRGYPYETAISEKFQSMVALGDINDRIKDFFDIWLLSQQVDIQGSTLAEAIQATFENRKTPLPAVLPEALTDEFGSLRQADWERLLRRSNLSLSEFPSFAEVLSILREFLWPVVQASREGIVFEQIWKAGGSWGDT